MPKSPTGIHHVYRNGSMLDMLPDSIKAHVVQYLKLDDVHQVNLEGNHIPDDIIFQYINWTDFEEPIRYIFRDFESVHDARRLQRLEGLIKSEDFMSYFSSWGSVLDLTLSYEGIQSRPSHYYPSQVHLDEHDQHYLDGLLNWIKATEDSPAKKYILSKLGLEAELHQILERGRWIMKKPQWHWAEYTPAMPPVFIDVLGRLIIKGDQESVLLFDQLLSIPALKKYFLQDLGAGVFTDSMAQICPKGGQPNVLLKDEVVNNLSARDLTHPPYSDLLDSAIAHDRFDILDGIVKRFEGWDFFELFDHMFYWIVEKAGSDPEYDCKLAKDLLQSNIDAIRNAPKYADICSEDDTRYGETLHDSFLHYIFYKHPTPRLQSLFFFMMEQFQSNGIQVSKEQALWVGNNHGNDFYNDYLINCL